MRENHDIGDQLKIREKVENPKAIRAQGEWESCERWQATKVEDNPCVLQRSGKIKERLKKGIEKRLEKGGTPRKPLRRSH